MKVLLYFEKENLLKKSGVGRALNHQMKALTLNGVEYTTNPNDTYDLVHINTLFNVSYRFLKKCKKKNLKVIVHGHSTYEDFKNSFRCWKLISIWFNRQIYKMYSNADYIITPTKYSKNLIENYKGVTCKVVNISNGIDLTKFNQKNYSSDELQDVKNKLGINTKYVVIGIGMFFERKGIQDFFEVARMMPDITFVWFGEIYKLMTTHKVNKARRHRTSNVILPGYVTSDIISKMFSLSSCFFFPSYEETEGIVVLEALANKCPVIVRDVKVFEDWLQDGVNCYKGKSNDDFKKLILKTINEDTTDIVNNGYKVAEERSIDKIGMQLKQAYTEVLSSK